MGYQVVEHRLGRQHQQPVELDVAALVAVAPLGAGLAIGDLAEFVFKAEFAGVVAGFVGHVRLGLFLQPVEEQLFHFGFAAFFEEQRQRAAVVYRPRPAGGGKAQGERLAHQLEAGTFGQNQLLLLAAALFGELFLDPGGLLAEELGYPLDRGFSGRSYLNLPTFYVNYEGFTTTSHHFVGKWEG